MGNIVLLDDLTINKIAAGEVIERPASVVKELVENSIDAGADNISIEIKNGGISYIRITDNGKGFEADDLEIAFERHATSKIRNADDLATVKSIGFRGEALASIAAIARVELVTKTEDSEIGHKIVVEGGKVLSKEEIGCPKGTSITIESLFYNTPVRYKFLKKDFTESGYIEDVVARIALVNPNIAIKYINTGKTVIQTSGNGEIKDIVYGIYGKDVAENIINVEYYFEDMAVKGIIGKPSIARSNRSNQLFFVNKRYVKDKTLTSAAEQAFKGLLPIGKYGFLILNLEIDPQKLDVNVHPAKLEVRFQEENKIFKLVYHAIKETMLKVNVEKDEEVSNEDDGLFQKSYIEDLNSPDNNTTGDDLKRSIEELIASEKTEESLKNEENSRSESRGGIGGFLKNILGGSKNEFSTNDDNLVEQLYRDKIEREHNNTENTVNNDLNNSEKSNDSSSSEKASDVSTNSDSASTGVQASSNLERLIKELDANLEKLNMKPKDVGLDNLTDNKDVVDSTSNVQDGIATDTYFDNKLVETEKQINDMAADNKSNQTSTENVDNSVNANVLNNNQNSNNIDNKEIENHNVIANNTDNKSNEKTINTENNQDTKEIKIVDNQEKSDVNFEEMYAKMFGTSIAKRNKVEEEQKGYSVKQEDFKTVENLSLFTQNSFYNRPIYKFIGIVFGSFIVIEYENEMYIVNQRAANERILFEKVKKNYYSDSDKDSQLMLLPDVINLSAKQMGVVKDNFELFKKAGFDLEEFGENTVKLSGVPNICIELDTKQLFIDILEEINTVARTARQEVEEKFIATVACKAAEKSGIALSAQEVDVLMQQLLALPHPFVNPNGEPTAIRMSKMDIERKFSRR